MKKNLLAIALAVATTPFVFAAQSSTPPSSTPNATTPSSTTAKHKVKKHRRAKKNVNTAQPGTEKK